MEFFIPYTLKQNKCQIRLSPWGKGSVVTNLQGACKEWQALKGYGRTDEPLRKTWVGSVAKTSGILDENNSMA